MNLPNPKTIQEAQRQIRTAERACELLKAGYQFSEEDGVIAVCKPGQLHASYFIGLFTTGCDCPDYQKHQNYCKHTLAWDLLQKEREELDAFCAAYEETYANDEGAFSTNGGGVLW